jgi:hypothetical protein
MENQDIEILAREADDAFWEVVSKRFPTAETGDLSPEQTITFRRAATAAIKEWIGNNVPRLCKACGSEIVATVNDSNFNDGDCGPCEYRRYRTQPEVLTLVQTFRQDCADQVQQYRNDLKEDFGDPDDLQERLEYWQQRRDQCDAVIAKANG